MEGHRSDLQRGVSKVPVEFEVCLSVPAGQRDAVRQALTARGARVTGLPLQARYCDTPGRDLARAGLAWRMRREGTQWVQALKAAAGGLSRLEHEVRCEGEALDERRHAGTAPGRALQRVLDEARAQGVDVQVRFGTDIHRLMRRTRVRGAVVDIAFDEGVVTAGSAGLPVCELEFELVAGSAQAMLALARRWCLRFGLGVQPYSKAERGDALATSGGFSPEARRACPPRYGRHVAAAEAMQAVFDECLDQIVRNAAGLQLGDPGAHGERVHQLRVGIRRLRSALRGFDGRVPALPAALEARLRAWFGELGVCRDRDVQEQSVSMALAAAGAPPLPRAASPEGARLLSEIAADTGIQALLLDLMAWRSTFAASSPSILPGHRRPVRSASGAEGDAAAAQPRVKADWRRTAHRQLRRWHRRMADAAHAWDRLDEQALHRLRRRAKRLRYLAEFLAPALEPRPLRAYLQALAALQERLGEINDLIVARDRYAAAVATAPQAWFALGWIAARLPVLREAARPLLLALAGKPLPRRR